MVTSVASSSHSGIPGKPSVTAALKTSVTSQEEILNYAAGLRSDPSARAVGSARERN